ncbi:MAG: transcriptional regulator [Fusobacterium varium]|jgi:predicted transcriptional regulator of viral defense system|uniref:transcriptional regulator n=1 Tax=Fusobacterium varium TaxID=856 RepID=UPI000BBAEC8C|nr:transcriptional regulator [Fusobacterium varium]MCI6034233.1 transcriptional regulator [Fusobacterium varium]MDY4006077.1 transcriptional regulator [Fusobacterium varium]BBA50946.1 hypothetical protein FV113G1_12950 [Fusobacterium varium]DAK06642.1 MAG TPA: hypothetical protein [Caudoviricetes sp.]
MNEIITVEEVAQLCKVKTGKAYKIMRELNNELEEKGYITMRGRINKSYLLKRLGIEGGNNVSV